MQGLNLLVLIGEVSYKELKYTVDGKAVLTFKIEIEEPAKAGTTRTNRYDCSAWGKLAEALSLTINNGSTVAAKGRLRVRRYQSERDKTWRCDVTLSVDEARPITAEWNKGIPEGSANKSEPAAEPMPQEGEVLP